MKPWMFIYATNNKFDAFGKVISMNTDSNLMGAYILRSTLGLHDNLLLIRAPPAEALPTEASVGVCSLE